MKIDELISELEQLDFTEHEKAELALTDSKSFYIDRNDRDLIKKILKVAKNKGDGYSRPENGTVEMDMDSRSFID